MRRYWLIGLLIIFVLSILSIGAYIENSRQQERTAIPIRAELTMYSDLPNTLTKLLTQQYELLYHVRVHVLPLTEEQMAVRMTLSEADRTGDIVLTSRDSLHIGEKYGQFIPVLSEGIDEISNRFKQPDGLWVGTWYDPVVFVQNSQFYNGEGRYINTWHSLAMPGDWTVVMTDFVAARGAANILYGFVETRGEVEGLQYFMELKPHVVQYAKFLTTPVRLAALGETDIGIGNYSDAHQYEEHKYPLKVIFPLDGTPYYLTGTAVLKSTKNKEESERFIKWLLSKQTAQFLQSNDMYFGFTNPEVAHLTDSLGREAVLLETKGDYTEEGKKRLLNDWISQVRFRKGN